MNLPPNVHLLEVGPRTRKGWPRHALRLGTGGSGIGLAH